MVKRPPLLDGSDCTDRGAAIAAAAGGGQPYVELANPGDETSSMNDNHVILDGLHRRGSSHRRLCIQGPPKP
jgi:hypothetical protein